MAIAAAPSVAAADPGTAHIAIVGASMSAGFGGPSIAAVTRKAAPNAIVDDEASSMMFRKPVAYGRAQVDAAIATHPDLVFAVDFLFWDAYEGSDVATRLHNVEQGLADLDRLRAAGALVVVGDVPRIVTASTMLIPSDAIPPQAELDQINARIRQWAAPTKTDKVHALVVPFASWCEPLAAGADIELAPGEHRPAKDLMSFDGLHPNALGVWYVMTKIDHALEQERDMAAASLVFARP